MRLTSLTDHATRLLMYLAQRPQDIFIGSVVCSMAPDLFPVECFSTGNACGPTGTGKPAGVINGARRSFMTGLDGILPAPAGLAATQVIRLLRQAREQPA